MKSLVTITGILAASSTVLAREGEDHGSAHEGSATPGTGAGSTATTLPHPGDNGSSPPKATQTGCPTVTVTGVLCPTCAIPACLGLATATQRCGCPEAIPTVTLDFPCEDKCSGVFCSTTWMYESETCRPTSGSPNPSPTGSGQEDGGDSGAEESSTSSSSAGLPTVSANFGNRLAPFWVGLI